MAALDRLRDLMDGVRVTSPTSFQWYHRHVSLPVAPHAHGTAGPARAQMINHLERWVYTRYYLTGGRRLEPMPPPPRPWLSELPIQLRHANCGTALWQPDWTIVGRDGEFVVVERASLRVWARPEEIVADGATVRLRVPVDLPGSSPGFYCARGEAPPRGTVGPYDRYYWNLRPAGAVPLVRGLTARLNEANVPFLLKIIADPEAFGRADAGMLQVERTDRESVLNVVRAVYADSADVLEPPTPAFTKALAPGLGYGQHVDDGLSFGAMRSLLVAEAIVAAFERGEDTSDGRLATIRRVFNAAGLDLDRPHLAPNASADADPELPTFKRLRTSGRRRQPGLLEVADRIGHRLCDEAIWSGDACT